MYAAVFPLVRTRAFTRPFDYAVPDALRDSLQVGSLVAVPLARRMVLGLVLEVSPKTAHRGRIIPVTSVVDLPPVPVDLIDLAKRVQRHYVCPLAAALSLVTPPADVMHLERVTRLTEAGRAALAMGRQELAPFAGSGCAGSQHPAALRRLRDEGLVEMSFAVRVVSPGRPERVLERGAGSPARLGVRQQRALQVLEEVGTCSETELRRTSGISAPGLNSLIRSGAVVVLGRDEPQSVPREYLLTPGSEAPPTLVPEQEAALRAIRAAAVKGGEVLLHGVTGSGKTEVYLRAAAESLAAGRSVLLLVPEIALTGQTVTRLRRRFPGEVLAVLHSGLPAGERVRAYAAIAEGRARIVVGARSAIFAPVETVGLIVVDEEHDDSYKQENEPRYDARTVARWRAAAHGATLVLGSATPRVETWAVVSHHVPLKRRVDGSQPPELEVVDMRDSQDVLCPELRRALVSCVEQGQKAILFLNRRGVASYVSCGHCGHTWMCPDCDVAYGLVRRSTELRCRICGRRQAAPRVCPVCGSLDVGRHGVGTERLEAEVATLLPGILALRLDSDVAASYRRLHALLDRFARPGPAVLVGTQMVAKGHHFPEVTLVGVVNADLALYFPDYRAEERTFAMLLQVAGRAGRGRHPGRVIVQTYTPDARPIVYAAAGDLEGFYKDELERRCALAYPPAATLIVLHVSAASVDHLPAAAVDVLEAIRSRLVGGEVVLGPGAVARERGRYLCRCVIKTTQVGETIDMVRRLVEWRSKDLARRGVRLVVDVEPVRL